MLFDLDRFHRGLHFTATPYTRSNQLQAPTAAVSGAVGDPGHRTCICTSRAMPIQDWLGATARSIERSTLAREDWSTR
jgi:hypothetical protein